MITIPGADFYLCGGAVRDKLMGKEPHDHDYVVITNLPYYDLIVALVNNGCDVLVHEPDFFTIRVMTPEKEVIDIVYPRKEGGYVDGRHPENVTLAKTLEEDSKRRDFTINAMYMDKDGKVIDYQGGQEDIKNKVVRFVGDPSERCKEDYLRILRAVRFAIQLGFTIEEKTVWRMMDNFDGLKTISSDRIRDEINKMLRSNPKEATEKIWDFGLVELMAEKGLRLEVTAKR